MAKIKSANGEEIEIKDGGSIREACERLRVPFSCGDGICGTCRIEIIKGGENLSPLNEKEKALGGNNKKRFACQCKLKKGEIKIKF